MNFVLCSRMIALAAVFMVFLTACGRSDSKVEESKQMLTAWSACIGLATRQWEEHRVPDLYVRQLLKVSEKALAKQRREIEENANEGNRPAAEQAAGDLQSRIATLKQKLSESSRTEQ
jgi:hypothetical protein